MQTYITQYQPHLQNVRKSSSRASLAGGFLSYVHVAIDMRQSWSCFCGVFDCLAKWLYAIRRVIRTMISLFRHLMYPDAMYMLSLETHATTGLWVHLCHAVGLGCYLK